MTEILAAGAAVVLMVVAMTYGQITRTVVQLRRAWEDMAQLLAHRHDLVGHTLGAADAWIDVPDSAITELSRAHREAVEAADGPQRIVGEDALDAAIRTLQRHTEDASLTGDAPTHASRLTAASEQIAAAQRAAAQHAANYQRLVRTFPGKSIARRRGLKPHEHEALADPRAAALHLAADAGRTR